MFHRNSALKDFIVGLFGVVSLCFLVGVDRAHAEAMAQTNSSPNSVIHLGVEDGWPPYANERGQGLSTDIIKAAFAVMGQEVTISVMPYARVLRDVEAGHLDGGYNVTRQTSTEKRFIFGQFPILTASASFYYAADRPKVYQTARDIPSEARVASIIDYEYGNTYESQRERFNEVSVARQQQVIRMLLAHRVDVGVMFDRVVEHTLAEMNLPADILTRGAVNHTSDIYVAFSLKSPEAKKYAALLDQGLLKIRENGVYDKLMQGLAPAGDQ
ncbi:substrate-binding periplasmic protein [Pseudomaricurvus albidus]|uniref:substrate-binding periplasmic protein n=1 Tax=Pseudomaricurvus albidus TaxID=2842452 RepID=UPI001C0ACA31|nr:transporter substrate-binding domain-containing protein [Aestuariicella albida]